MAEFLPPSMPERVGGPASPTPGVADGETEPVRSELPRPIPITAPPRPVRPGALGRLVSLVISLGLAWALAVAITAWLLGTFLARS